MCCECSRGIEGSTVSVVGVVVWRSKGLCTVPV